MKKWLKALLILALALAFIKMMLDVWQVFNFSGGNGYVNYSPDGEYKITLAYKNNVPGQYYIVTHLPSDNIQAIIKVPRHYVDAGVTHNSLWYCAAPDKKSGCYKYVYDLSGENDITLPPTPWQHLHAWLTINLRGLDKMNLVEYPAQ